MKRALATLVIIIILIIPVYAQVTGDGSKGNPYTGTINSNFTISGTKYFVGTLLVKGGTLTISPGAIVIARSDKSVIRVTDTGKLDARGTATNRILFTADIDGDPEYGKLSDIWGNITILAPGPHYISYATIENGRRTAPRLPDMYGGGIHIGSSPVSITHTTIRQSRATYGGAISVAAGASPVISDCIITGNNAIKNGGAIYIAGGASPVISNCIISGNSADENGGAIHNSGTSAVITNTIIHGNASSSPTLTGGAIYSTASALQIVNSVIANNSSPAPEGHSLAINNSPNAHIVNTIIWGGSNHLSLTGGTPSDIFDYCAIEGATFDGCLTLSGNNTDPDGPHFTDPGNGDFSIAFASPCRDSGADTHADVTIPVTDMNGKKRIGTTDMGAREVRYSRWSGRITDWNKVLAWEDAVSPGSTDIIIPAGLTRYPVVTPASFTLSSGLTMIVEPGAKVSFTTLTNNGTIDLQNEGHTRASLMADSYNGSGGSLNMGLFLEAGPGGSEWWHYIAVPATVSKTLFTTIEPDMLVRYDETRVVSAVVDGWQWHDGYGGTTPFSELNAKEGYDVSVSSDATMRFTDLKSITTSLGTINLPFSGSGKDTTIYGYSLLGNSLTCGIDWNKVTYSHSHNLIRHAYYIRTADGSEASYVNGVGTNGATAHIAPLQGFFVRTRATGTSLTIPNSAREHNEAPRFKAAEQIPLIRLALTSGSQSDETVIRFAPEATMGFDGLLDASKPFTHVGRTLRIYSELFNEQYSINSIPWPAVRTRIPLSLVIHEEGEYTITSTQLQALGTYRAALVDELTGRRSDLSVNNGYSFKASAGTITGRFSLEIIPAAKKTPVVAEGESNRPGTEAESSLKIWSAQGSILLLPQGDEWDGVSCRVRIFDITGRVITAVNDQRFTPGEMKEFPVSGSGGLLIVEVINGEKRHLEKVVLSK